MSAIIWCLEPSEFQWISMNHGKLIGRSLMEFKFSDFHFWLDPGSLFALPASNPRHEMSTERNRENLLMPSWTQNQLANPGTTWDDGTRTAQGGRDPRCSSQAIATITAIFHSSCGVLWCEACLEEPFQIAFRWLWVQTLFSNSTS